MTQMEPWVRQIIKILEDLQVWISRMEDEDRHQAISNALHVFKNGKGFLTNGLPTKIVFFGELHDRDAGK
jgi:hypothetical protein